jgi:hypothetical protein
MTSPGPFANNQVTPSGLAVGRVARTEATREVLAYLEANDLGLGIDWESLAPGQREQVVDALSVVFSQAERAAAKAAIAELALYEKRALDFPCPRCKAEQGEPCRDLRYVNFLVHVRHPHQDRVNVMEQASGT